MGIRIRPREIDITEKEPFRNDLLDRKESVEVLTHLVESIEGPCVLAVDAAWGTGKTTFLTMWAHHFRKIKFPVVEFNAWETDFSGDPFIALSTELAEGIKGNSSKKDLTKKVDSLKKVAKQFLKLATSGAVRYLTGGILDVDPLLENQSGNVPPYSTENRLNEYLDAKKCIKEFKRILQDLAVALSESHENRPLIVVIDELDRCRPSYAVELLEVVKHLFGVDRIVFVLAINRSELAHSVRALYGSGFDADNYLRRFFDVDFRLPEPERKTFIDSMINTINIEEYFGRTHDKNIPTDVLPGLLQAFFSDPDLSLRTAAQAIHRLGLVFASLRSDQQSFIPMVVVLLILRTIDSNLYSGFIYGEINDAEVVKTIFARPGLKNLQRKDAGDYFEAMVILGTLERSSEPSLDATQSPLYKKYKDLSDTESFDSTKNPDHRHASDVLLRVSGLRKSRSYGDTFGFKQSVQRLELLTSFLIDEHAEATSQDS